MDNDLYISANVVRRVFSSSTYQTGNIKEIYKNKIYLIIVYKGVVMKNTSLGYHTFSFFQRLKEDEYFALSGSFMDYANLNKDMKMFPVKNKKGQCIYYIYSYRPSNGIRWLLLSPLMKNGFIAYGILTIIDSKVLIEGNYITASKEDELETVERIYNGKVSEISPILNKFGECSLSRVDPCLNIDLQELNIPCSPAQMISLIKQGNIPEHYQERKVEYNKKQHRRVTDKNSFYLESKSSVINYYWKYPQQDNEKHPNYFFKEASRNVIRLEVQCKYLAIYNLAQNIRNTTKSYYSMEDENSDQMYERMVYGIFHLKNPADVILRDSVLEGVIQKHFYRIVRKGDYFTLDGARIMVKSYDFRKDKEERLIYALEQVKECHGIAKAKEKLRGQDLTDFKRSLRDLDDILVNPVTIPRRWGIEYIPNLLSAYFDVIYEEQIVHKKEFLAKKRIEKFLLKIEDHKI